MFVTVNIEYSVYVAVVGSVDFIPEFLVLLSLKVV